MERKEIDAMAINIASSQNITRAGNNELWGKLGKILYAQQIANFPLGTRTKATTKGKPNLKWNRGN